MSFYQVIAAPVCGTDGWCTPLSTVSLHARVSSRRTTAAITTILRRPCRPTVWSSLPAPVSSLLQSVIGGVSQAGGHQSDCAGGRDTGREREESGPGVVLQLSVLQSSPPHSPPSLQQTFRPRFMTKTFNNFIQILNCSQEFWTIYKIISDLSFGLKPNR